MKQNQFPLKSFFGLLFLMIAIFSILSMSSCTNAEKPPKGLCITLSKSKIDKAWSTYIKNGEIDYVKFITFYNPITHEMNVSVQAFKKNHNLIGPFVKLVTEDGCANLLPKVAVGENIESLAKLGILDETNRKTKDFGFLVLKPVSAGGYLAFETRIVDKNNKMLSLTSATTLPCPPCINCRPACPTDCTPACTPEQLDSLAKLDTNLNRNIINDNLK